MHLLDVNALIALSNRTHVHHTRVRRWFESSEREAWATCPLTENGLVRIIGHPNYREFPGGTNDARGVLAVLVSAPGHQFWSDDLSVANEAVFSRLPASSQITDCYLLALAVQRRGQLATLDQRIDAGLVTGGQQACFLIPELRSTPLRKNRAPRADR